jgi:hypothetical protein
MDTSGTQTNNAGTTQNHATTTHHHVHGANNIERGRPTRITQPKTVGNERITLPYAKDAPDSKEKYAKNKCAKNKTPYR